MFIFIYISQGNASDQKLPIDVEEKSSHDKSLSSTTKSHISQESSDTEDSDTEDRDPSSFVKLSAKKTILPKSRTDTFLSQNSEPFPLPIIPSLKIPGFSHDVVERSPSATHAVKSPRPRPKSLILHTPRDDANTIERPQHSFTLEDVVKTDIFEKDLSSQNTEAFEDSLTTTRKKSSFLSLLTPRSSAKKDSSEKSNSQHLEKQPSALLRTFRSLYRVAHTDSIAHTDLESLELAPHFPKSPASSSSMVQSVESSISLEATAPFITFESIITPQFIETYQTLQKFYEKVSPKRKSSRSLTKNIDVAETQLRHITERLLERLSFVEKTHLSPWYPHEKITSQRKVKETEAERVCHGMKGFRFQKSDEFETVVEYRATSFIPENKKRIIFLADLFSNFFEIQHKGTCVADLCTIPYTKLSDAFLLFLTFPNDESQKKSSSSKKISILNNAHFSISQHLIFQEPIKNTEQHGLRFHTLSMQTDSTRFMFYNNHSAVLMITGLKHRFEWFEYIDWRRMLFSGIQQSIDFVQSEYIENRKRKNLDFIGWKNPMNLPYIQELLHHVHPEKACAGQTAYYSIPGISESLISLLDDNLVTPRERPSDLPTPLPETTTEENAILN